ncbi:4'-phosphopantetheinyl transferase superfamily protein [Microbacterium sp. 16-032]|uniref:4'-phosphopantetheinyl transferase family protein n=1 Tax=Microbacterium sp. 16-032 TaxID=3239808 RepID=UPI0034E196A1
MNRIELEIIPLEEPPDAQILFDELNPYEQSRYRSIRRSDDRLRYLLGHGTLRRLLASQAGVDPRSVSLDVTCGRCGGPHGRPRIEGPAGGTFRASISHAGGYVVIAVGDRGLVGVDIEPLDAADWEGFDETALTAAERADVAARRRPGDRARLWTRKEAVLKALGRGLLHPLHGVDFGRSLERTSGTVAVAGDGAARDVRWAEVPRVEGYAVTVAVADGGRFAMDVRTNAREP